MSGILERIEAKLDQLLAGGGTPSAFPSQGQLSQTAYQPQPQVQATPQLAPAAQQQGYPPATSDMITALVTPLAANETIKAALKAEMTAMGIAELPQAQPHQYGELYYRFQQVAQRFQQQQQQPQPAAAPASII